MTELQTYLASLNKTEVKRIMEALPLSEDEVIEKLYQNSGEIVPQPVETKKRESAEIVANNPDLNLLLVTEAMPKYKETFQNARLNVDEVLDLCAVYTSLPINEDIRVLKIQTMFALLAKPDSKDPVETGNQVGVDFFESEGELIAYTETFKKPPLLMEPWVENYLVS